MQYQIKRWSVYSWMLWIENQTQSECWNYHWNDKAFWYNCYDTRCKYYCRENCFESNKDMHYLYALSFSCRN